MQLLIVTGMSGAGKTQAANALEDMGFYCVDNIPPSIIPSFVELSKLGSNRFERIAVITDARGGEMFSELFGVISELKASGVELKLLFLDAYDEVLIRRYKENRRSHPLSGGAASLADAVEEERRLINNIRVLADYVIDTSYISVSQLKVKLSAIFSVGAGGGLKIQCKSFGFKYGSDTEADLVIDVRCLPNPFYIAELKPKTGLDSEVREYVMESDDSKNFFKNLISFIDCAVPLYLKEGKSQLTIAFGCTGGKHRSVTFAELIGKHLKEKNFDCVVTHRDIQK